MADTYEINFEETKVGTARMEKQGLYYSFSCRCRLPDDGLYRIHVICGGNREDLGICVPMDGAFGTDKKIPSKRLGDGAMAFELLPKDWKPLEVIVPEPVAPAATEEKSPVPEPVQETAIPESTEETSAPEPTEETFIPVSEEEPFEHLDKLENAVLAEQNGQLGITIQEMPE